MNGLTLNDIAYRVAKHGRITRDEPRQDELDAIKAHISHLTSREAKGAASYADDPTFPADDRSMLLFLNREFDTTASVCARCGHEEDARTMDAASMLRDYLVAYPAALDDASAHHRPTCEAKEFNSDAGKHRMDSAGNCAGELFGSRPHAVQEQPKAETPHADLIYFLEDLHDRYALAEDECACDFVTRTIRALSTPAVEEAAKPVVDPPLAGRWHHGKGFLCCGTFRIAREDWEAGVCAAPGMREEVFDWMCERLNATEAVSQPKGDSYRPTDAEVRAWLDRSDIDDSRIEHWRTVIDDARSMHLLAHGEAQDGN